MSSTRDRDRYGRPAFRRPALLPALLAGIALLIAPVAIGAEVYTIFRFLISILALIVLVFAFQAKQWWWIPVMLVIAVVWNPVYPFAFEGPLWRGAHYVAILGFVLAGVLMKVPVPAEDAKR